ncbi:hypothetical protein GCM10007269_10730 [Microbacterium murale]|uniref:DNA (cytosine-5-)-methyltransferase n=2 Tax=Microbacterium murale TaxID=1081040 RepID=A0ABQ1RJV6_9MICO|nr:hypothetical protein GCM10007269_10730 [Microbacterium murale]
MDAPLTELQQQLKATPLSETASLAQDEHDVRTLAHTIDLNDLAVADLIGRVQDPLVLAYAVATLTQKAFHTYVDPRTGATVRNLSGAKRAGTFFTPPSVASEMAKFALDGRDEVWLSLEPASGTGMLTSGLLVEAARTGVPIHQAHAWELSPYLSALSERIITAVIERLNLQTVVRVQAGDAIALFDSKLVQPDVLVMNPPYGRVKYLKSEATNAETKAANADAAVAAGHAWVSSTQRRYSATATRLGLRERGLDHQRVFMAAGMEGLASNGRMVCIAPSSWTSGPLSRDIRELLLRDRHVQQIVLYPEDAKLFPTVNQPTGIVVADRDGGHESIQISVRGRSLDDGTEYEVSYSEILNTRDEQLRIPMMRPEVRAAFEQVVRLPRIADLDVKNARGELDLTADKWMLSEHPGSARVVRGDHVQRYDLSDVASSSKPGWVTEAGVTALTSRAKWVDSEMARIVGRQVAYMGKSRRLSFAEVPAGSIVSNSCNYLAVSDPEMRAALLGFLNSAPAEWWFRLHNANNHVSNGELDQLPWPLQDRAILEAVATSATVRSNLGSQAESEFALRVERLIDALVCFGMGLTASMARPLLEEILDPRGAEECIGLLDWFRRHGVPAHLREERTWMQHELNTLSELDYEMIRHIPIGGNWQQIPESVPSERLKQIRAMSAERGVVRTTYYGRLRPEQPSYTVATYYNRPGNGTNIHPVEDRTLSHREAARLQSFPDSYAFIGGDGAIRKQIGNAVPPLLGRAVAGRLLESGVDRGPVVDLFAGAGGLSLGFEIAGMSVAVAADSNESALRTYAFNRPTESIADPNSDRTLLVGADLSDPRVREDLYASIRQKLNGSRPSALIGGPPCQGFSHAGFRDPSDPRSDLAVAFLDFVDALEPDAVVLENVEGILTARGGKVARDLIETLNELGYPVARPWVLAAEQFGVPQMRRRVFLVARRGESVTAPDGPLDRCLGRREGHRVNRAETYPVTVEEAIMDLPSLVERQPFVASASRPAFARWATGRLSSEDFLHDHTHAVRT